MSDNISLAEWWEIGSVQRGNMFFIDRQLMGHNRIVSTERKHSIQSIFKYALFECFNGILKNQFDVFSLVEIFYFVL